MKHLITLIVFLATCFLRYSIAKEARFVRRNQHFGLTETGPSITSTIVFADVDTSHTIPTNKGGASTSQEPFIEPTELATTDGPSNSKDPDGTGSGLDTDSPPPPPLSGSSLSSPTSKKPTGKPRSSSVSSEPPAGTTTAFYEKLVKIHINPTPAANHPTKPTNYPAFADYDQGIVYLDGIPHQVLAADTDYNSLNQAEDGTSWEKADKKDEKARQEELESELEHQNRLEAGEGGYAGNGNAVYSADQINAADSGIKKAIFFSVIAAGIISIGLLVYFGVIGG